ncbi:LOW QUALITY PROTEIN: hypothetical protein ACHAW6_009272 [Cyclotella cf. meneghiniana]
MKSPCMEKSSCEGGETQRPDSVSLLPDSGNNIIPPNQNMAHSTLAQHSTQVNSIYECENTSQFINFYYATMSYPVISMWTKAIDKGYLRGWNGLTSDHVRCFINPLNSNEQGYMDQRCAGI